MSLGASFIFFLLRPIFITGASNVNSDFYKVKQNKRKTFRMYKICFYVPATHLEQVKNAMFLSGAGHIGNYRCCAWQILGEGQFMPLAGSHSFIGEIDHIEKVAEYKVEIICADSLIQEVIAAMKQSHPYEEPAYQVLRVEDF
jgi:structural hemagglutinin/hemolysin toxin protein RtxA